MRCSFFFCSLLAAAASVWAASPSTPTAGVVRDSEGTLRPVYGIASNLINGRPLPVRNVGAAAFSTDQGIILVPRELKLIGIDGSECASFSTAETHPVLSINASSTSAVAWLPSEERFVRFWGSAFAVQPFTASQLPGAIQAIEASTAGIDVWVAIGDTTVQHLRISNSGEVAPLELTPASPNFTEMAGSLVFSDENGLEVSSRTASPQTLPLPFSDLKFEKAGAEWLHITSATARKQWMLHLSQGHATLSELPALRTTLEARQ